MTTALKVDQNLVKADILRIISKGFSYPSDENLAEIRGIAEEIAGTMENREWGNLIMKITGLLKQEEIQPEYSRLFLMKKVPMNESNCCARLAALSDVAGFYRAFGMKPRSGDSPDSLHYELEFLALLRVKYSLAGSEEQKDITRSAYNKFLDEHMDDFAKIFSDKMKEAEYSGYYKYLVDLLNLIIYERI